MSDTGISREEQRELIRQKIQNNDETEKQFVVIPAVDNKMLADASKPRRVCAYCRVSTDDPAQTTSYELQKKHYEKEINETPGWIYAGIYADEGISATSLKNRDEFNRMIADCYAGKIDLIVTKNVSRFARNVVDCLSVVRKLAQLNPPVGVKFENEGFYSLDATSELLLTVLAASAQEESKTKSNSMNWSLEKRFDNPNAFRWGAMKETKWRAMPKSIAGFAAPLFAITGWDPTDKIKLCGHYMSDGKTQMLLFDMSEPEIIRLVHEDTEEDVGHTYSDTGGGTAAEGEVTETIEVMTPETVYPDSWTQSFGRRTDEQLTWYYERIQYDGDWEILRPAKCFAIAGGVSESVLNEVERETRRIIAEMRRAV